MFIIPTETTVDLYQQHNSACGGCGLLFLSKYISLTLSLVYGKHNPRSVSHDISLLSTWKLESAWFLIECGLPHFRGRRVSLIDDTLSWSSEEMSSIPAASIKSTGPCFARQRWSIIGLCRTWWATCIADNTAELDSSNNLWLSVHTTVYSYNHAAFLSVWIVNKRRRV